MENKLRKKFVYFSVGIITIVLLSITAFVNITNFYNIKYSSDNLLNILVLNDGEMPKFTMFEDSLEEDKASYAKSFSNRFFTVKTDVKKNIVTVNTDDVFLTSSSEAVDYAKEVL